MIEDARRIPNGAALEGDLCIVGGGAAGIAIAREFIGTACKVILLVGAGKRESAADRDLYRRCDGQSDADRAMASQHQWRWDVQ